MRYTSLCLGLLLLPAGATAQSSEFGIRGLGLPGRGYSTRSMGMGGGFAMFDPLSSQNPASLSGLADLTALLTTAQNWRTSENPFGSGTARDNRFPQIYVGGPVGDAPFVVAFSLSTYTDRNFSVSSHDSIPLRGAIVGVFDTLISLGGLSDLRLAGTWRPSTKSAFGFGFHIITGSERVTARRTFSDSAFFPAIEATRISYNALGVSIGVIQKVGTALTLAASARVDGRLRIEADSTPTSRTSLPTTLAAGLRWQFSPTSLFAGHVIHKNWSTANADLRAQGGIGSIDTYEVAGGFEFLRDPRRPYNRPLRFGARYGKLPFPLVSGQQGKEFGLSVGTGLGFTADRGIVDLALERVWRSEGSQYSEHAFILTLGIQIRP